MCLCLWRTIAKEGQSVIDIAARLLPIHGRRVILLTQLISMFIFHHRDMGITRRFFSQDVIKKNLSRGCIEKVVSAHNIGDTLVDIVYYDRELISKKPVFAVNNKITAHLCNIFLLSSLNAINKFNGIADM